MSDGTSLTSSTSTESAPTQEELIALLDPKRGYGARSFEEVVAGIRAGEILIQPGGHLPVLKDAVTLRTVKGTGVVPGSGSKESMNRVRARFNAHFDEDEDEWYSALYRAGVDEGDPRAIKIAYEMRIGKPGEARDGAMSGVLQRLIDMSERLAAGKTPVRDERVVTVEVKAE